MRVHADARGPHPGGVVEVQLIATSIGFTGTRHGMTNAQVLEVHMLLGDLQTAGAKEAHHGMCVGADKEFHDMAVAMSYRVIGHPGVTMGGGKPHHRAAVACDLVMPSKPFLVRNRDIVREVARRDCLSL